MWKLKSREIQRLGKNIKEAEFCTTSLDDFHEVTVWSVTLLFV